MLPSYKKFLLQTIEDLKKENKELQARNDRLVEAMVPILRRMNEAKPASIPLSVEMPAKSVSHRITYSQGKVSCLCGWEERSDDSARLQEAASTHHREHTSALRGGRKSWPQAKNQLEQESIGGVQ